MTDGLSMGSMSSDFGSSSSIKFSSDTLIMTGGTTSPTPVPTPVVATIANDGNRIIPPQWTRSSQSGVFFDPVTSTSWIYDPVLMVYISPNAGWFLIIKGNQQGQVEGFYYYDIAGRRLYNSLTGAVINTGQQEIPASGGTNSGGIAGVTLPTSIPTHVPSANPSVPVIATGTQSQQSGITGQGITPSPTQNQGCLVPCQSCPSGQCNDCNNNGICDENEGNLIADSAGGISEKAQDLVQRDRILSNHSGGSLPESLSEEAQASIYYLNITGKGPFEVIECSDSELCVYCIDEDKDGLCSDTDCHLITCNESMECTYCLDCNHDGYCDIDKLIITNCSEGENCITFDYCDDPDRDGICNDEWSGLEPGIEPLSLDTSSLNPVI
ncbi:MAG: hypothetical protein GXY48_05740 [Methanomicrobiales archaeon]|nr:hypothetical protein [Methanomicrobiales archaeon]